MIRKCCISSTYILTLVHFLLSFISFAQTDTSRVSFTFIGDVMGHDTQIRSAYQKQTNDFDYNSVFQYLKPQMSAADFTIANLEVTLGIKPYKGYPSFSSPAALASGLQNAGVDALVTANNHSCDRGKSGIITTLDILDNLEIQHTGTFRNSNEKEESPLLILEKDGIRVALLNYTYGTNGIPVPSPTIVNLIDKTKIEEDIIRAKKSYVDKIILFVHWGLEYQSNPSKEQQSLYQYCIEKGADIIIGSHPHVLQRIEKHDNRFVAYSLGNFVSNQRKRYTDGGTLLHFEIAKLGDKSWVENPNYQLTWVYTPNEKGRKEFYVLPASKYEQEYDFFVGMQDYEAMMLFLNDTRKLYDAQNINVPEKYYNSKTKAWEVRK
ncbi:MAG: CapA family protein [Cyclobacteriaceae bacterium]|nr:CapA family protein [Cyclobacteriaceae bacterium]